MDKLDYIDHTLTQILKQLEKTTTILSELSLTKNVAPPQPPPFDPKDIKLLGAYRIYWKDGGYSIAVIGNLQNGTKWYAPANWSPKLESGVASTNWEYVIKVELIQEQQYNTKQRNAT